MNTHWHYGRLTKCADGAECLSTRRVAHYFVSAGALSEVYLINGGDGYLRLTSFAGDIRQESAHCFTSSVLAICLRCPAGTGNRHTLLTVLGGHEKRNVPTAQKRNQRVHIRIGRLRLWILQSGSSSWHGDAASTIEG